MTGLSHTRGFILPVVLWLIAAIGLVAAVLSEWVSQAVTNAIAVQERMESDIAFANIRNEIVFAVGRRPYSYRGLEVGTFEEESQGDSLEILMNSNYASDKMVVMDGRPHVVENNKSYAVQIYDGRGLINLNSVASPDLQRLFESQNIPRSESFSLIDGLIDYRDEDSLQRASGAEQQDYTRLGLPPPADAKLLTPWEARRIIGWARQSTLWDAQYKRPVFSTCQASGFNPNTAPPEALVTYVPGISLDNAEAMVEFREKLPFRNIRNVGEAAGIILIDQPFTFSFKPSTCLLIDLVNLEKNERIRFSISLIPFSRTQPWQIDYVLRVPKAYNSNLDQLDPSFTFPSPEEIARRSGNADSTTGF